MQSIRDASDFLLQLWNDKNVAVIDEFLHEGSEVFSPVKNSRGPESLKLATRIWFDAFPEAKIKIRDAFLSESGGVALWWESFVRHEGCFLGVPASGKEISYTGTTFLYMNDRKIETYNANVDLWPVLRDLRVSKVPVTENSPVDLLVNSFDVVLHPRELECISLLSVGLNVDQIARIIYLSPKTVRGYFEKIRDKFHLNRTRQIVSLLVEQNKIHLFIANGQRLITEYKRKHDS